MNIFLLVLALCLIPSSHAQQPCLFDYQCGDVLPYKYCDKGAYECTTTVDGFAVTNSSIYYAQLCNPSDPVPYTYGNYTFKRIPIGGGIPETIYSRKVIPAPGNPSRVLGIADDFLFFATYARIPGVGIASFNVINPTREYFLYPSASAFFQGVADFDVASNVPATYICSYNVGSGSVGNYTIERYPVFTGEGYTTSRGSVYQFPQNSYCGAIKRHSDVDLFFTRYTLNADFTATSYIYKGSITCSNCALPQALYSVNERILDLDVSSNYIFFGTTTGLYRVNLDGTGFIKVSTDSESATAVHIEGKRVIYNNGIDIKKVDIDGTNTALLTLPAVGQCACRRGFTGAKCNTCNGQIQWQTSPPRPVCVPLGEDGVPTSCFQDYQCGNPPFTVCLANKCSCIDEGFTGARCDICNSPRQISWSYGSPRCA